MFLILSVSACGTKVMFSLGVFITGIYKGFMILFIKFSWAAAPFRIAPLKDAFVWIRRGCWERRHTLETGYLLNRMFKIVSPSPSCNGSKNRALNLEGKRLHLVLFLSGRRVPGRRPRGLDLGNLGAQWS